MRISVFATCLAGFVGIQPIAAATIDFELTGTVLNTYSVPESIETDIVPPQYGDVFSFAFQFDTDAPLIEYYDNVWPQEGLVDDYAYYETTSVTGTQNGSPIQSSTDGLFNNVELFVYNFGNFSGPSLSSDSVQFVFNVDGLSFQIDSEPYSGNPNFSDLPLEDILQGFVPDFFVSERVFDSRIVNPPGVRQQFRLENLTLTSSLIDDIAPTDPIAPDPAPSPVPLPASIGFLLAGLAALKLLRRRSIA